MCPLSLSSRVAGAQCATQEHKIWTRGNKNKYNDGQDIMERSDQSIGVSLAHGGI
jgi:hypothetical protein